MKYALFGAGELGQRYYELVKDEYEIVCFIDNDPEKQGVNKYMSLDVVSAEEAKKEEFFIVLTISEKYRVEVIRQLYEMGIKVFYIPLNFSSTEIIRVDMSPYKDISEQPNKICVIKDQHAGTSTKTFSELNPFDDIVLVVINSGRKDGYYYYNYITSKLIITQSAEARQKDKMYIEIWHGFTIKAIGYLEKGQKESAINKTHSAFNSSRAVCSLSKLYSIFVGYCNKIDYTKFRITGYPRNDMIFRANGRNALEKLLGNITQKRIVFYAPTFRHVEKVRREEGLHENGEESFVPDMKGYENSIFNEYLKKNDILFIYKKHTYQREKKVFIETDNIRRITDDMLDAHDIDLYEILNGTDCLISDYSSIIIDYLLADKPMIFTPTDLEAYSKTRRLMLEPYDAWMPGDIALDYEQLESAVTDALFGEDKYKNDRERLRRITHKYADGNSTVRVLALAREIMGV